MYVCMYEEYIPREFYSILSITSYLLCVLRCELEIYTPYTYPSTLSRDRGGEGRGGEGRNRQTDRDRQTDGQTDGQLDRDWCSSVQCIALQCSSSQVKSGQVNLQRQSANPIQLQLSYIYTLLYINAGECRPKIDKDIGYGIPGRGEKRVVYSSVYG